MMTTLVEPISSLAAGPVDLLHLAVGGDEEVDVGRLVHDPEDQQRSRPPGTAATTPSDKPSWFGRIRTMPA